MVLPRLDGQSEGMSVYSARVFLSGCSHILPKPSGRRRGDAGKVAARTVRRLRRTTTWACAAWLAMS